MPWLVRLPNRETVHLSLMVPSDSILYLAYHGCRFPSVLSRPHCLLSDIARQRMRGYFACCVCVSVINLSGASVWYGISARSLGSFHMSYVAHRPSEISVAPLFCLFNQPCLSRFLQFGFCSLIISFRPRGVTCSVFCCPQFCCYWFFDFGRYRCSTLDIYCCSTSVVIVFFRTRSLISLFDFDCSYQFPTCFSRLAFRL